MKRGFMRAIAILLATAMLAGIFPLRALAAASQTPDTYTLSNGFLKVLVSAKNGGFDIRTVEGDQLNKDDNNKYLLFPRDENDTSFTSFRVTRGGVAKDYIFGGSYSFLGLADQAVQITQDATGITATWGVEDLTFTQRIELANTGSNHHGMAYISYTAATTGEPAEISARILMDTALGYQDFAVYELAAPDGTYTRVQNETAFSNADGNLYEKTFFAYDDVDNPTILAYTVNASVNDQECVPEKVAFGHWNNLAASVYDFTPDASLTFTNPNNKKYLTADSAYALYYDLGTISAAAGQTVATYYGVYSNEKVSGSSTVAVNLEAPASMELAADKKTFLSKTAGGDPGNFTIQTTLDNFASNTAKDYDKIKVAVYCQTGITPVSDDNVPQTGASYNSPYTKEIDDFKVDETKTVSWNLNAAVGAEATYRKVQFKVFDVSPAADPTGSGQLLEENLLGEGACYILCPGGDGTLPEIKFTGSSPEIIYYEGNRHFFLTGSNFSMLENQAEYRVLARPKTGTGTTYEIPASQFLIDSEENTIDVLMTKKMNVGDYELVIDYTDTGKEDLTAPALGFVVSDDKEYRNDGYGVVAVVQKRGTSYANSQYEIKAFTTESAYQNKKSDLGEVLLELRGEFIATAQADDGTVLQYSGISTGSGNNVMTLNNCIDIENGKTTVEYVDYGTAAQAINVDFDAELYTTGARTTIWKNGISALTAIQNGTDYELLPYDTNGQRQVSGDPMANKQTISLIWPSAASAAQTLGGIIFELRYGELGVIKGSDGKEQRQVIAFGAMMDLSFVIPSNAKKSPVQLDFWDKVNLAFLEDNSYTSEHMRSAWEYHKDQVKLDQKADQGQAAVKVKDILFGGEYIGFNAEVEVQIPGYTSSMPTMAAKIKINTIGDWSVGVAGKCKFTKLEMEAEIVIKSKDGYPVPDKLYFFIKGFKPGVNIDGFGVVWLQGGGGGIDKLYDTIFSADTLPPLKILISAQLSIMQVFSARADLSLSLRGIGIKVSDGVILDTDIKVLNQARLQFDWYPEFNFLASVSINLLEIVTGGGYIVVQDDGFFEFFVRAGIKIPDVVLFIGGMHLGSVDLGANSQRIWGGLEILHIRAGICYYWGGDFDFGFGGAAPDPTFPELLGVDDIPVYTDPQTGRVLYLHVGTNFAFSAQSELVEELHADTVLMGAAASVQSKIEKKEHTLNLGVRNGSDDAILSIGFDADSKAEAQLLAGQIAITQDGTGAPYGITIFDQEQDADSVYNQSANANVTYDADKQRGSLNVTFTENSAYAKTWNITTPAAADLLLYNVEPMASLDTVSIDDQNGDQLTAGWSGTKLEQFDSLSFLAVADPDDTAGTLLYKLKKADNASAITNGSATFTLPDNLESGTYYLKVTASKEGELCETAVSTATFTFVNDKLPVPPDTVTAGNGGDYQIDVDVTMPATADYDGYLVNVYEQGGDGSWTLSEYGGVSYEQNAVPLSVGGRYSYTTDTNETLTKGLTAGKTYKAGVSAYREEDNPADPDNPRVYYSVETFSGTLVLAEPDPASVSLTAPDAVTVSYAEGGTAVPVDTYRSNQITFTMTSDQPVTGVWTLDTGYQQTNEDTKVTAGWTGDITASQNAAISLTDLIEGHHTLTFLGVNGQGDGVIVQKRFAVDTQAPRLLLETPVNGGFFEADGTLEVKGITDIGATLTINGTDCSAAVDDESGAFSRRVILDAAKASQQVTVAVQDAAGNAFAQTVTVRNKALGLINGLKLYADGNDVTNRSMTGGQDLGAAASRNLILRASVGTGNEELDLNDSSLLSWNTTAVAGSASVSEDGVLTLSAGARGIVSGTLAVADAGGISAAAIYGAQDRANSQQTYTVSFASMGGSDVASLTGVLQGAAITAPATPTRDGYTFGGWYKEASCVNAWNFDTDTVTSSLTLYAKWTSNSTGTGGGTATENYTITASAGGHGTISPAGTVTVAKNSSQTFRITPETGYKIADVQVDGKSVGAVTEYTFENVTKAHTIQAAFSQSEEAIVSPFDKFTDVAGHWAEAYIKAAVERGLFNGVTENLFQPDQGMTRGMFVTILGRLEGIDPNGENSGAKNGFSDVGADEYYAAFVAWAAANGITNGTEDNRFLPGELVTREQIAVMLYRYAQYKGLISAEDINPDLSDYTDQGQISDYARSAIQWAVAAGILKGSGDGTLHPQDTATRAEVAAMIMRWAEQMESVQ